MRTIFTLVATIIMALPWSTNSVPPSTVRAGNAPPVISRPADALAISSSAAFPATGILDSFNHKGHSLGSKWSMDSSRFKVVNNQLSVASQGIILWNAASFGADQEAYVTFVNVNAASTDMDLLLKSQSSGSKTSLLEVVYKPASKVIQVNSYTSANGLVQYGTDIPVTFSAGDQLGARAGADGQVYVYKNGALLATRSAAAWSDHGKGGYLGLLSSGEGGSVFDNFGGGTIVMTATSTPVATSSPQPAQTKTSTPRPTTNGTSAPIATGTAVATSTSVIPTNTPRPTATRTSTLTATRTAIATNTAIPPTATSRPASTNTSTPTPISTAVAGGFRFISWGDSQDDNAGLAVTSNQAKSLNPAFTIFNGDLENDGVTQTRMDAMTGSLGSLFSGTFLIRGNHDDHVTGSAGLWENYFVTKNRALPNGVKNYVSLDSGSTYLNYSFDYGNSRFIGLDVPGDVDLLTNPEYTFLEARLTDAEKTGLTNAFIYWHGPEYCVESIHCNCTAKLDGSCTPSALITIFNRHPIVSATFHGHEHILGWVHMDSARVPGITHPYEEFLTSSSTPYNSYNAYLYPARVDYYYPDVGNGSGFAAIDVNGNSFTFSIYKVGTTAPVWSKTFTKGSTTLATNTPIPPDGIAIPTATKTSAPATKTAAATSTSVLPAGTPRPTATRTSLPTATQTATPVPGSRPLKYYLVDRVLNTTDYAKLASWGIDTAVVNMGISASSSWTSVVTAATNAGINIVIWPDQGGDVSGCGWETPFNSPLNGDYIWRVKAMLDALGGNPHVIGIVTAHEPEWNQGTCRTLISDMAAVKNQIKDYIFAKFGRTNFKVWNYIDNISDMPNILDYSGPSDYARIMDVAVTWQHCAGNAESACDTGSYSALSKIINDRNKLIAANAGVDLVYIVQTFTSGGSYGTKFSLSQLENYSCEFLNTNGLDGFGFYTWDAGWWPDLHSWTDLQPAVPYIHNTCVP